MNTSQKGGIIIITFNLFSFCEVSKFEGQLEIRLQNRASKCTNSYIHN